MVELSESQRATRAFFIQERSKIKTRITKLKNYLRTSGIYGDEVHIDQHLLKIQEELKKLPNIETELLAIEPEGNHQDETENILFDYEGILVFIRKFKDPNRETMPQGRTPTASSLPQSSTIDYLSSLPKVEAKKFDGQLENWRTYRDWFKQTIHNRDGLSDSQRLDYLKRTLTGEAEKTIAALQATDENYSVAWKLLETTYNLHHVLVFRHCDLLMETPAMRKSSAEEIRKLINRIQTQILAMKALGERVENWNTLISYIILRKLDRDTEREWNRTMQGSKIPDYEDILQFLREQAIRLTSTRSSWGSQNTELVGNSQTKQKPVAYKKIERVQTLVTSIEQKPCPMCTGSHILEKCERFLAMNISDRINAARQHHLCLNCFRGNHKTRFCKAPTCETCQKRHNVLVHLTEDELKSRQASSA